MSTLSQFLQSMFARILNMCLNKYGVILLSCLLYACSDTQNGATAPAPSDATIIKSPITIDNTSLVPVFDGAPTTTYVFIHNNSDMDISGIAYRVTTNLVGAANNIIAPQNIKQCSAIKAQQTCTYTFTTPALSDKASQAAIKIQASYKINGKEVNFSNIINYADVYADKINEVKFSSNVVINTFGNPSGCATLYLYAGGEKQLYSIDALYYNKLLLSVTQGSTGYQQLQSGDIRVFEVCGAAAQNMRSLDIAIHASLNGNSLNSIAKIGVSPITDMPIIITSVVPLINSAQAHATGTLYLFNAGDKPALIETPSASSGLNILVNDCGVLPEGASCDITFEVTQSGGTAEITIPYAYVDGGGSQSSSVSATAIWYNGVGGALVQMQTQGDGMFATIESATSVVAVTNIGGYDIQNVVIPAPIVISGSGVAMLQGANTCSGTTLLIESSCSYTIHIADTTPENNKQINLGFSGVYNNGALVSYSRIIPLQYSATPSTAILNVSSMTATVLGNGADIESLALVISNSGIATANFSNPSTIGSLSKLSGANLPTSLTQTGTTCGTTLAPGAVCGVLFHLGPESSSTSESGIASYTVLYSGPDNPGSSANGAITWNVVSAGSAVFHATIITSGFVGGNGESAATAFAVQTSTPATITVRYTNDATVTAATAVTTTTTLPPDWTLTTHGCQNVSIGPGENCTDIYTINAATTGAKNFNFNSSIISWTDLLGPKSQTILPTGYPTGIVAVNVYAPAVITASLPITSIFNNPTQGTMASYTVNFSLSGGYSVPASSCSVAVVGSAGTTGFTANGNCAAPITSTSTSCTITTLNPGSARGTLTLTPNCTGVNVSTTPTTLTMTVKPHKITVTTGTWEGQDLAVGPAHQRGIDVINGRCGTGKTALISADTVVQKLAPYTNYYNASNELIGLTESDGELHYPLSKPISAAASKKVWTGMTSTWSASPFQCYSGIGAAAKPWEGAGSGMVGDPTETTDASISSGTNSCAASGVAGLYCVE